VSKLAVAVDLRSMFGAVRNQGSRPTCLAFAASDAHAGLRPGWAPLSCEFAFYHAQRRAGRLPNQGALLSATLEALREDGQPEEAAWPYLGKLPVDVTTWVPPANIDEMFTRDGLTISATVDAAIRELSGGRPVILLLQLSASFFRPDTNGVVDPAHGEVPEPARRHAVTAVGHGTIGGQRSILVRNSWGDRWAAGGYAWLTEAFLGPRLYAAAKLTEEVNVLGSSIAA
jgi:Papain family cysteine protease